MTRGLKFIASIALLSALGASANAQMTKSDCETLRGPMSHAATQLASFLASVERTGFAALGNKVGDGAEAKAFERLMAARQEAIPAIRNYTNAIEDFSYAMQSCAR